MVLNVTFVHLQWNPPQRIRLPLQAPPLTMHVAMVSIPMNLPKYPRTHRATATRMKKIALTSATNKV